MSQSASEGRARDIVVVGAGGHAKVAIECLRHAGWTVVGCTDADPTPRLCAGTPVLGTDALLDEMRAKGIGHAFCALGANAVRDRVGQALVDQGFDLPAVRGPGVNCSSSVHLGVGCILMPGATVNVDTVIGALAIINTNASIDHDGVIGRAAHIAPGAALAGEVTVGDRSFIATGSSVIPRIRIGVDVIVGAGSVVLRDLPDRVIAYGNPARVQRSIS